MKQETITGEEWRRLQGAPAKANKFGAEKVKDCPACGCTHDSKMEARRCAELHLLRDAGEVVHVDVHPVATIARGIRWTLDFLVHLPDGSMRYEDVKGHETGDFKLKRDMYRNGGNPVELWIVSRDGVEKIGGRSHEHRG